MDTIYVPSASKQDAGVIFIHGLGQSNETWKSIVLESLAHRLPTVAWILPQSINRPVTFSQGQYRPSWFDIARLPPDKDEYDEVSITESITIVEDLILAQVHAGIDSRRIVLVGFSQGAALSLMTALTSLHELGGVVSLSGWIPHQARPHMHHVGSFPILWCHGTADDEIPLEYGQEAAQFLISSNQVVRFKTYEDLSHSVNSEEIDDLGTWLEGTLAK